jgi:hypothetical protein
MTTADENDRPQSAMEKALTKQTHADRAIHAQVQEYIQQTVAQLGGWSHISISDLALILCQKQCLTMALALEAQVVASGNLTDGKGRASPLLFTMTRFQSEFRQGQIALGLARARVTSSKPRDRNPTRHLDDILKEYKDRAAEVSHRSAV